MILLLSPSKSMNVSPIQPAKYTQPVFLEKSEKLIHRLRTYSPSELMRLMKISEPLAELNHKRFAAWQRPFSTDNAKPAHLTFTGAVYDGLDTASLLSSDIEFSQQHLLILSGLYGLLRPLDLMQPYRLEMGCRLERPDTKNLYEFWKSTLTARINDCPGDLLVNLASQEYFKAIDPHALNKQILSPVFKDEKNGVFKIISIYAKRARGTMARFIIQNQITKENDLLAFNTDGSRVYVTDAAYQRVWIFDADLDAVTFFGTAGNGPGEFLPESFAVPVDTGLRRLNASQQAHP